MNTFQNRFDATSSLFVIKPSLAYRGILMSAHL